MHKKRVRLAALALIALLLPAFVFAAGYREYMEAGLAAYKQDRLQDAYKYYYAAYRLQPSQKLLQVLAFIKNKYNTDRAAAKPQARQDTPLKWALLGGDAAALGLTVFLGADYYSEAGKYNKLYDRINNTTMENYNRLVDENKVFYGKEGIYTAGIIVTSLLAAYTLADLLFIHAAFPVTASAGFDPRARGVRLAVDCRY